LAAVQNVVRVTFRSRIWSLKIPLVLMTQASAIAESATASSAGVPGLIVDRRGLRLRARALEVNTPAYHLRRLDCRLIPTAELFSCTLPAS
jgi:hypothetical protein